MAHSDKHQPGFSNNPDSQNRQKSQALSRDIEDLNNGLRVDFDQKLSEIADLLARFKALMIAPNKAAANDESCATLSIPSSANSAEDKEASATVTPIFKNVADNNLSELEASAEGVAAPDSNDAAELQGNKAMAENADASVTAKAAHTSYAHEPARFETGLYKLNSQLYRFRLELDQEMEFREEPLHLHFQKESDLSLVFQKLNDRSGEKHTDN